MAYDIVKTKSIKCGAASLASYQYSFVNINTSGLLALPSAGGRAVGVLQDAPGIGSPGAVCFPGDITKIMAGAAGFAAGDNVMTDASGYGVTASSGRYVLGVALTAGVSGSIGELIFQPGPWKMV